MRRSKGCGRARRSERGFTLIEMLIVVILVAILAAAAMPQYSKYVEKGYIADAMSTLSSQTGPIEAQIAQNNKLPANNSRAIEGCPAGWTCPKNSTTGEDLLLKAVRAGTGYKETVTLKRIGAENRWCWVFDGAGTINVDDTAILKSACCNTSSCS